MTAIRPKADIKLECLKRAACDPKQTVDIEAGTVTQMPVYWMFPTDYISDIHVEYVVMTFICE
jgi:hypothetical protein